MYYKAPDNSVHFLDNDQYAVLLPVGSTPISEEEAKALTPPREPTLAERIAALEAKATPRRLREAVLGIDNGWLANLEAQIAEMRKGLS